MGACDFHVVGQGQFAREVFGQLIDEARYECGHGGYTGTIAEKHSFVVLTPPSPLTPTQFIDAVVNEDHTIPPLPAAVMPAILHARKIWKDKWGPALAVRDGDSWRFFGLASS